MINGAQNKALTIALLSLIATPHLANADEGLHVSELVEHFLPEALAQDPSIVDCTLSGGTQTKCLSLTINAQPVGFEIGPWCPTSIEDGPEKGGIWLHDGNVVDVDGAFIQSLPERYNDSNWQLFDPKTGKVRVTDTKIACESAARPNVAEEYQNYCVECEISYLPEGETSTFVIPLEPVLKENSTQGGPPRLGRGTPAGVSFNGLRLDQPAPVDAILSAYTIAAFDDCGGHVNPFAGYHTHVVTDCHEAVESVEDEAAIIGIALDGFPMLQPLSFNKQENVELDECNGHSAAGIGYHYHAGEPASNNILPCHTGDIVKADGPH